MNTLRNADVAQMTAAATEFLAAQPWCGRVVSVVPVFVLAGDVGAFRCSLIPSQPNADVMVWVVVGDLPSAYLVHEPGDSWQDAFAAYVTELSRWENDERLASRLEFIRTRLVDVDPDSVVSDV
ncbi:MAG TPA: hypothetical protein VGM82_09655 [Gemmatimonadaceae bacterium]|jgi:hypothetical protein